MRAVLLVSLLSIAGCVLTGEKVPEGRTELRSGGLRAVIADNEAHGAVHRAGYSGVAELEPAGLGRNVFVPAYAGLNFEHILSGDGASYGRDIFEPRRAPMAVWRLSGSSAELRQERTESWPLRTRFTYAVAGDDAIDLTVSATPLSSDDWKKHGWLGLFFASYIDEPEDRAIHFIGRSRPGKGDATPRWIRHLSPRHGEAACHRPAGSAWDPPMDPGLPIPLATGQSDLEYVYPFYYGVTRGKALIFLFEKPTEKTEARLAQSPTGGGETNPAWDFIFIARGVEPGKEIEFRMRLVCRDFRGREDVIRAYEAWSGERVERPRDADPVSRLLEHVHPDMLYEPAVVPDEENAYLAWKELSRDLENRSRADLLHDPLTGARLDDAPPPSGDLGEQLGAILAEKEGHFRVVEEGVSRGRFRYPRETLGVNAEEHAVAVHSQLSDAALWRVLRIKMAAGRGAFDVVERDLVVLLETAAILASSEDGVQLHGRATHLDSLTGPLIRWLARYEHTPVDLLERLLARHAGPPDRTSLARALRAELRNHILPWIARVPDGADPARLAAASAEDVERGEDRDALFRATAAVLEGHPEPFDREATVRLASELMAELARSLDLPWRDRARKVAAGVYREAEAWPEALTLIGSRFPKPRPSALTEADLQRSREALRRVENPFGKLMIRKLDRLLGDSAEVLVAREARLTEAEHEATRVVVALLIHARRNGGALPGRLEDLVPARILPSVPRDPFTDEPFRYSRERAIVWSAGSDEKDDGGRPRSDFVWELAPIPGARRDR